LYKFIFEWPEVQTAPGKGNNRRQWISKYANHTIPIPPLHVQEKIVSILDTFTELTKELTKEQQARQTQYEYYRDKLLTFEDGEVEWVKLQKIARLRNGKDWKSLSEGDIPVYGSGGVMAYVNSYAYNKPTVLIPRIGTLTNIFYVEQPFWNVDTIFYTEIDIEQINPKYFYYFIKSLDLMSLNTGTGRPSLTQTVLNKLKIPIPPLHIQQEIVDKLDRFNALANSITEGLPREIELRQQQYEYYRDLLLDFPKAA